MLRRYVCWLVMFLVSACAVPETHDEHEMESPDGTPVLADMGPAPEFTNDVWLNVDSPLRLADLRGKVVLLEMWNYG